jgi:staphylococcal nuclease domain-containing protein 1
MEIRVTEVTDAINFFYRDATDNDGALVDTKMAEFPEDLPPAFLANPPLGNLVAGLYNDGNWYRARVEGRNLGTGDLKLCFIDFGNHEALPLANLRPLPDDLQRIPPQAKPAILAGLKPPASSSDHFEGAAVCFSECALERVLTAQVEFTPPSGKVHVTLTDPEHPDITLNMMMARDGWCRVLEKPESRRLVDYCKSLKADENIAKQTKLNIWEYGNVSDDEEEQTTTKGRQGGTGKPAPAKGGGVPAKGGAPAKGAAPAKNSNLTKFDGRPPKRVV